MTAGPLNGEGPTTTPADGDDLTAAQVGDVLALADLAARTDGVAPLSEEVLLHLRYDEPGAGLDRDLIAAADGAVAGYAHLDAPESAVTGPRAEFAAEVTGELVVHPEHRRRGLGRSLLGALSAAAAPHTLQVWAHGDLPAAQALAASAGFERSRALWQQRRSLREPLDPVVLPAGYTLRTFVPGQDEDAWLALNALAFARHPEQGGWTRHDLELREREPWFDPAGFFIADAGGRAAGFHWTKVHDGPPPTGEVYVVGVDPAAQGTGLGRALTLAGLHYLRNGGLDEVLLYVDEDNKAAIRMYEKLGFRRARVDAVYRQADAGKHGTGGSGHAAAGRP